MRLGLAYEQKGQVEQAVAEFKKGIALDKTPARLTRLGEAYALWAKKQEALQVIGDLKEMSKRRYVAPTTIALVYARLGQKEEAITWLQKAKPDDDPNISDPGFDSLRPEPRFRALETQLRPNPSCPAF
jgi:serine/threonine-protein kinase